MNNYLIIPLILVAILAGVILGARAGRGATVRLASAVAITPSSSATSSTPLLIIAPTDTVANANSVPTSRPSVTPTASSLPQKTTIRNVPFVPQAPHKDWDATHEETCEEAAALTLHYFATGRQKATPDQIEADLQAMLAWETDHFGTFEDTTAAQTAQILRDYLGYGDRVRVIQNATLGDLRRELTAGRPVIAPAAGRLIGNRYFKHPGPIYHMTVAIGYDRQDIITNDPGTQHGQGYRYPIETFWNAVHDFVDQTDNGMARGPKNLIVID